MNTPCPHCQVEIEIDPHTLAALEERENFACPACEGLVAVPQVAQAPVKVTSAAIVQPSPSPAPGRPSIPPPASAQRGLNRNMLILGGAALLVLGGIAFMLASRKSGYTHTTTQDIRNEIINNSYFQNLIATGVTTMKDLEAIADIRPYEDGFIGITAAAMSWKAAQENARRMGAGILDIDIAATDSKQTFLAWLGKSFPTKSSSTAWVLEGQEPGVLVGDELLAVKDVDGIRAAFVHWRPNAPAKKVFNESIDLIALIDPDRDMNGGIWRKTPEGLLLESGKGVCLVQVAYTPPSEYDYILEFTLFADWIGHVCQQCTKNGKNVSWTIQSYQVGKIWSGFRIDSRQMEFSGANVIQPKLIKGVRYRSVVQVRKDSVRGYLNDKMLVEWKGEFDTAPPRNSGKPIAFSAWDGGILFHKAEMIPFHASP